MTKTINVITIKKEGTKTVVAQEELEHDLESLQKFVGGYIEVTVAIPGSDDSNAVDLLMVLNDEGKMKQLPPTIAYVKDREVVDFVAGNAFITRRTGEDFGSVTDEDFRTIQSYYHGHAALSVDGEHHHVIVFDGNKKG
ncbi:hypothetical protein JMA_41070 (plasmid) [Jeotgalibacillus malaysiensis]|uniref:DUF3846 domain-containing protein n=1 Tax=Jeotgalibacillus malaysiensis TaxID=1508404 RepID=A0A0B5AT86_9BACL|nr:DUF3846 domain-containing protein [Jeotgalibacillus malaysiensis]AJD93425.1 hypothetical protein JMA_41070 [Jeotgalibacillus malaysiensis]